MPPILTAALFSSVVGKAHGRQLKPGECAAWKRELKKSHTKKLEAPSWLWTGVVDLVSAHEGSYLRHCRDFAITEAKTVKAEVLKLILTQLAPYSGGL